ncbi:MAG TPA: response regulator [Chloroflexota bacterium]|nr:response regulator [Chloroflexota bacterium]
MEATTEAAPPTVLVVEDDPTIREVVQALLESLGHTVAAVADGQAALDRIHAGGVDLVLLDLMLPDVNGLELCRRLRAYENGSYLPIIMLTALNGEADRHAGFAAGADDYIGKPFDANELLDRAEVWLRTRQRLKQQQAVLRRQASLLELATDGIFVRDLEGVITYWSTGAVGLYGWTKAEAQGKVSHELLHTEFPRPRAEIEAAVVHEGGWEGELIHTRRDGTRLVVASRWSLQRDDYGRPLAILELNTDVTERQRLEAERAERARLEGVVLAARTMEHELNNKLTPTAGYAALLARDPALPAHLRRAATQALGGAQEASRILNRLRQLTAIQEKTWGANVGPTIDLSAPPE